MTPVHVSIDCYLQPFVCLTDVPRCYCSAGALGGRNGGNEARGGLESSLGLSIAEALAHRSEEEWLKA